MFVKNKSILGIDYGLVKVGVAIATGPLAEPLTTLNTKTAILAIKELVEKHKINKIIIGDTPEDFLQNLKDIGIEVEVVDETLTSYEAREKLFHTTQKRRKNLEHQVSAAIILQNWLDSKTVV